MGAPVSTRPDFSRMKRADYKVFMQIRNLIPDLHENLV
jgi:hypothetical protein